MHLDSRVYKQRIGHVPLIFDVTALTYRYEHRIYIYVLYTQDTQITSRKHRKCHISLR